MSILCGTDFSPAAERACDVAAILAEHHGVPLVLVHAVAPIAVPPMQGIGMLLDDVTESAHRSLSEAGARLAGAGREIRPVVAVGHPDEILLTKAAESAASLIVLGSVGHRGPRWLLGSTADRIASRSAIPVLVVREKFPARQWLEQRQPLRVIVAADLAPSSDAAVEWASHLPQHGPCSFTVINHYSPSQESESAMVDSPMRLDRTHPLFEERIERALADAIEPLRRAATTNTIIEPVSGRVEQSIVSVAQREGGELLVLGRGRSEARHWWESSVSRAVVQRATMSVVCVPDTAESTEVTLPRLKRLMAATDFSRLGNAAVAHAISLLPADGQLLVVHALQDDGEAEGEKERRRSQLLELVRRALGERPADIKVEILAGDDPARLISEAAETFDADLICLGSRGRSGLGRALIGPSAQGVLTSTQRPVLLVQASRKRSLPN